jgi:hypothetical protein
MHNNAELLEVHFLRGQVEMTRIVQQEIFPPNLQQSLYD